MTFEELSKNRISPGNNIWRYMSLHKFIHLISERKLIFNRLDQFNDPFEGITRNLIAERLLAKEGPTKETISPAFKEIQEQILAADQARLKQFEDESPKQQKSQFVNCWILSNRESMAMWNLYSNSESVAIVTDGRNTVNHFKATIDLQPLLWPQYKFICGNVEYYKLNPLDFFEDPELPPYSAFKKDLAFEHEKEYRFLIVTPSDKIEDNPKYLELEMNTNFFNNFKVVCHPEMAEWKLKNIVMLCKRFNIEKVERSSIEIIKRSCN